MLPVRIRDASQGLAVYRVGRKAVQAVLDEECSAFRAVDLGSDDTALEVFVVDYREGDLGSHRELGVNFFVTLKSQPYQAPGMYIKELPVDRRFTFTARKIWGYPKTLADLEFETWTRRST